jgi:hypothetical protein
MTVPVHPPELGEASLKVNLTAVMALPTSVSLGENLPTPVTGQLTFPLAGGETAPLTPESIAVSAAVDISTAAVTPSTLRIIIPPDRCRAGGPQGRPVRHASNAAAMGHDGTNLVHPGP